MQTDERIMSIILREQRNGSDHRCKLKQPLKQSSVIHIKMFHFRAVSQASVDSDIATAFQRRFHISVDDSEQNNVSSSRIISHLNFDLFYWPTPKIFLFLLNEKKKQKKSFLHARENVFLPCETISVLWFCKW